MAPIKTILCMVPYKTLSMNCSKPKYVKNKAKNLLDSPEKNMDGLLKTYGWSPKKFFYERCIFLVLSSIYRNKMPQ